MQSRKQLYIRLKNVLVYRAMYVEANEQLKWYKRCYDTEENDVKRTCKYLDELYKKSIIKTLKK